MSTAYISAFWNASAQSASISLANLNPSVSTGRESYVIDNSVTQFENIAILTKFDIAGGTPGSAKAIYLYSYEALPNETGTDIYPTPITGVDAVVTNLATHVGNLWNLGIINVAQGSYTYFANYPANFGFNGSPRKFGVVVLNNTAATIMSGWIGWTSGYPVVNY